LGISKTKTVRYLTGIHLRVVNQLSTKEKLCKTLKAVIINPEEALKLNISLTKMVSTMQDASDEAMLHCPPFEIFKMTIGTGPTNDHLSTDVLGIKCQTSKAALIRKFLIQAADTMEVKGLGKFVPARLAKVIGTEMMMNIIRNNNQYLKNVSTIPINGIPQTS